MAVLVGTWPETPLMVLANRDERLGRPWSAPRRWDLGGRRVFAPRDEVAGGTWLGVNDGGLFVGITNRFGTPPDRSRRSRGQLVLDALAQPTADAAAAAARADDPARHNGFHLLMADVRSTHLVWNDGRALQHRVLGPGAHVVTERSLDGPVPVRERHVASTLAGLLKGPDPGDGPFEALLASHADQPLDSVCVRAPEHDYGTRSSTLVRFGANGRLASFRHAPGPPDATAYEDLTAAAHSALTS